MSVNRRRPAIAAAVLLVGMLSACASDSDGADAATEAAGGEAVACPITVADPWVKATDTEMTGAFGVLTNTGDTEMTIVSASSPSAGKMEIHEVVDKDGEMVMQQIDGGLVIPAGGTAELAPGQNHLMLMMLPAPIEAGETVEITMTCADGGTAPYSGVAKPFDGGEESYEPGMEGEDMEGEDMEGEDMDASASPES